MAHGLQKSKHVHIYRRYSDLQTRTLIPHHHGFKHLYIFKFFKKYVFLIIPTKHISGKPNENLTQTSIPHHHGLNHLYIFKVFKKYAFLIIPTKHISGKPNENLTSTWTHAWHMQKCIYNTQNLPVGIGS